MFSLQKITFLCCTVVSFASAMQVTLMHVGQGNGGIVTYPNQPSMLIDFGSSQHPADPDHTSQKKEIISRAVSRLAATACKKVAIIASHPDMDHCNFICETAQALLKKNFTLTVFLGGSRADYEQKKKEGFDVAFKKLEADCLRKKFIFKFCDETTNVQTFCKDHLPSYCKIIAAQTASQNPNDDSVIVRVAQDDFSVLFLGDATDKVARSLKAKDIESKVMIFSHHGAENEKCTTDALIKKINPDYFLITAGMNGQYHHPCKPPIKRVLNFTDADTTKPPLTMLPHCVNLYHGKENLPSQDTTADDFKPMIRYADGFATAITRRAIYNTTNESDITITAGGIRRLHSSTAEDKSLPATAMGALERSYDFRNKSYNFDGITQLNLTRLQLTDDHLENFTKLPPQLERADFQGNPFTVKGIAKLATLLKEHEQPTSLYLESKYLQQDKVSHQVLQELNEKKFHKQTISHRTLQALTRLPDENNKLFTRAIIWIKKLIH